MASIGATLPGSGQRYDPDFQSRLLTDMMRKRTLADNQSAQDNVNAHTRQGWSDSAQQLALSESQRMAQDNANPRTSNGESMDISNYGGGRSASEGASGSSGGGQAVSKPPMPPELDGRYMPLIGMDFTPDSTVAPQVTLGQAAYSAGNAHDAQDAEFGLLKAKSGQLGRSAIDSLRSEMSGRGIGGSGTELRGVGDRIAASVDPLAQLNSTHLREDYANTQRERDIAESRVSQQFQGDITQRGQNQSMMQALNTLKAMLAQTKYQGEIGQNQFNKKLSYEQFLNGQR